MSTILTVNAGSTNTKLALFNMAATERIAHATLPTNADVATWVRNIGTHSIAAIAHRVVHGGREFTQPQKLDNAVIKELEKLVLLAPLHQPAALHLIRTIQQLYPDIPHIACFDTAFHHTLPEVERRLPLPHSYHAEGIQRYGFHGLSYQYIAQAMPQELKEKRVIVAHLGGGSSACAIHNGNSVATTMGFSTLDGLMMSTRPGALDAGVVLHLLQEKSMTAQQVSDLLYKYSGLKGVSGFSADMRELAGSATKEARDAVELYCHLAARQISGLIPAAGGVDAFIFTGGIGENNAAIRNAILARLAWLGELPVHVIPADEERVMAEACQIFCGS